MKDIAYHTQQTIVLQFGWRGGLGQPTASPDHHIVGQSTQKHHHLLRLKALIAAFVPTQALLVHFPQALYTPTSLIIPIPVPQQDGGRISTGSSCQLSQSQHLGRTERRDQ